MTLRRSTDPDAVLDAFETVAAQASTPILLQVLAQTRAPRPCPCEPSRPRRGHWAGLRIPDRREPLAPEVLRARPGPAKTRFVKRFASLPPLGRSFVDPRCATTSCRWRSAPHRSHARWCAAVACRRRTRAFIRLFLWWKNGRARTDIDLSAAFRRQFRVHADGRVLQPEGASAATTAATSSTPPQGASNSSTWTSTPLVEKGIRHVVTSINSYTRQPYCDLPECLALDGPRRFGLGRVPSHARWSTDRHRVGHADLACLVMDLQERRVIWADLADVHAALEQCGTPERVPLMLRALAYAPAGSGDAV